MIKKVSYSLTICAAIAMTALPATAIKAQSSKDMTALNATAMEAPSLNELTSTNHPTDATSQIKNATDTNYHRCFYRLSWESMGFVLWCF